MRDSITHVAVVASSVVLLASWTAVAQGPRASAVASGREAPGIRSDRSRAAWSSLPAAVQTSISAFLGREMEEFRVRRAPGGAGRYQAATARGKLRAEFWAGGVKLQSGDATWSLSLEAYGCAGHLSPAPAAAPAASANRIEYRRGPVTEWYANGPLGLEQGFTLSAPPAAAPAGRSGLQASRSGATSASSTQQHAGRGPVTIALELSGGLRASVEADGASLRLADRQGKTVLRYTGLAAYDARHKPLPARLELRGRELRLLVDDAGARYPVVIDPIVQLAVIVGQLNNDDFGFSMALSGNTLVVGAPT